MSSVSHTRLVRLTETAIMIALGTILSLLKLIDLPYGGSVTFAQMLPLLLIAYRYGFAYGCGAGAVYGLLQLLLGLNNVFALDVTGVLAIVLFDYLLAYAALGCGGIFRSLPQRTALALGAAVACVGRYLCHVISGATVWAVYAPAGVPILLYSFLYNATYMLPETLVTVAAAVTVGGLLDFRAPTLRRTLPTAHKSPLRTSLRIAAYLLLCIAAFIDIRAIFSRLQDAETGMFSAAALTDVPWAVLALVTAAAVALSYFLIAISRRDPNA